MATKKSKPEKVEAVEADPLPQDLAPETTEVPAGETDWAKPISASNPPPSKRPLVEQHSPVSGGDQTLQKDERELDEDLAESEDEVERATGSKAKRTRVTDTNANVGGSNTAGTATTTTTTR